MCLKSDTSGIFDRNGSFGVCDSEKRQCYFSSKYLEMFKFFLEFLTLFLFVYCERNGRYCHYLFFNVCKSTIQRGKCCVWHDSPLFFRGPNGQNATCDWRLATQKREIKSQMTCHTKKTLKKKDCRESNLLKRRMNAELHFSLCWGQFSTFQPCLIQKSGFWVMKCVEISICHASLFYCLETTNVEIL